MKNRWMLILIVLAHLFVLKTYGQVVTGKVYDDKSGDAMIGVSVLVKGTSSGSITDVDGNFKVNMGGKESLVFSYIGYQSQEVKVGK